MAPVVKIMLATTTVHHRPSSSREKNMKKAPKKPPAESAEYVRRVSSDREQKIIQILVKLLLTAFCSAVVMPSRPKSFLKAGCVIVVPINAES